VKAQDVLDEPPGASSSGRRVRRIAIDGAAAWVKDFDVPSPPKWRGLQSALFLVTRAELLRPVTSPSGGAAARNEIEAMSRFREVGAFVPELISARGARIVISDIGATLRDIERIGGESAIGGLAIAAAAELARVHAAGLVHGRPILRNLTWDGRRIGFIDFEEQPLSVMPRDAAQARDVLLFLISLGRRNRQAAVSGALRTYRERMPAAVETQFYRIARLARPLAGRLGKKLTRIGSRDIAGLVRAARALQGMVD
jgi:tRNA A-37 threonylcarbamoyl transferase component Bud32